jgi:hypothetical protein
MRALTDGKGTRGEVISLGRWTAHRSACERSPAIRPLLADSTGLVRAGFRPPLQEEQGINVIAEAASGDEAVAGVYGGRTRVKTPLRSTPLSKRSVST